MTHRERTAEITAGNHAVLDELARSGKSYRELARNLLKQMAWAQDKMERSEKLCKDSWDRAHLRTVKQALVFNHPLLAKERELIMELNPHVSLDAATRKALPVCTGVLDYFPDALLAVAQVSKVGNDQHNPGQPLHWAKEKSTDEADALLRHLIDRGKKDADGTRHSAKIAWRALALLQREIEAERAVDVSDAPLAVDVPTVPMELGSSGVTQMPFGDMIKMVTGSFADGDLPVPTPPPGFELVSDGTITVGDIMLRARQREWEPARPRLIQRLAKIEEGRGYGTFVARATSYLSGAEKVPAPITFELPEEALEFYKKLDEEAVIQFGDLIRMSENRYQTASGLVGGRVWKAEVFRPITTTPEAAAEIAKSLDPAEMMALPKRKQGRRWRRADKGHQMTSEDRVCLVRRSDGTTIRMADRRWEKVYGLNGYYTTSRGKYAPFKGGPVHLVQVLA